MIKNAFAYVTRKSLKSLIMMPGSKHSVFYMLTPA